MDPIEKLERKRESQRRLQAQRQRAGLLRGRVVAISLIAFVLLWGVVFAQMATDNDPVLSAKAAATRSGPGAAKEAIETTAPEEVEPEGNEPEPIEEEVIEVEPELEEVEPEEEIEFEEPAPVTTSQS
jgi:cytoskeletal protein RodZ